MDARIVDEVLVVKVDVFLVESVLYTRMKWPYLGDHVDTDKVWSGVMRSRRKAREGIERRGGSCRCSYVCRGGERSTVPQLLMEEAWEA